MTTRTAATDNATAPDTDSLMLIDLGSKKRKDVKRLRKGRGRLMGRVVDTVEELKASGEIEADSQVVVVVVKEKRKKLGWLG